MLISHVISVFKNMAKEIEAIYEKGVFKTPRKGGFKGWGESENNDKQKREDFKWIIKSS